MAKALALAFVLLVAHDTAKVDSAQHFPVYHFNVPGGFVRSLGDHKGLTVGYSFPGQDGRSVAKVYSAIGHTHGIEGDLPDVFDERQIVDERLFTLKATGGGFIKFVNDLGPGLSMDYLQQIIMDAVITVQLVEEQFGPGVQIKVSDFIAWLRTRGITIDETLLIIVSTAALPVRPAVVSVPNTQPAPAPRPRPIPVAISPAVIVPPRPALPPRPTVTLVETAPPPPPPPEQTGSLVISTGAVAKPVPLPAPAPIQVPQQPRYRIITVQLIGGILEILVNDESVDLDILQKVLIQSGLNLQQIPSSQGFGRNQILVTELVAFLESQGFSLIITEGPVSLGNGRYRLQMIDGFIIIIDDGYIDIEYLQSLVRNLRRAQLQLILSSGADINARDLVQFLVDRLGIQIDQRFILVQVAQPLRTWTVTLTDQSTVSITDDENVDIQAIQELIILKRVTFVMFQQGFRGVTGAIDAGAFLSWLQGLPTPSSQGNTIFVARFPNRQQTVVKEQTRTIIPVRQTVQQIVVSRDEKRNDEGSNEENSVIATAIRQQEETGGQQQALLIPTGNVVGAQVNPGGFRQQQIVQTFSGPPQIQRIAVKRPVQRVRVIPITRPVEVNEIVEEIRVPQQQQVRIFQQQPQQQQVRIFQQQPQQQQILVSRVQTSEAASVQQQEEQSAGGNSGESGQVLGAPGGSGQRTLVRTETIQQHSSGSLAAGSEEDSQNAIASGAIIGFRPENVNIGGSGISTVRFSSPNVAYETNQEGLVGSVRTTVAGGSFQLQQEPVRTVTIQRQEQFSTGGGSSFQQLQPGRTTVTLTRQQDEEQRSTGSGESFENNLHSTSGGAEQQQIIREEQQVQQSAGENDDSSGEHQRQEIRQFRIQKISGPRLISTRRFVLPANGGEQNTILVSKGRTQIVSSSNQRSEQTQEQRFSSSVGRASRGYLSRFKVGSERESSEN